MSKSTFKGSLLATTIIAGVTLASPVMAQNAPQPPAPVKPTDTQGNSLPAAPNDKAPPAGIQSNESSKPAQPTAAQEIVITGTLIRNPNLVASAPVTVLGHDEVQLRQTNTAEEILRTIPGAQPSIGAQVNNGSGGSAYVNLRGLGSNRNIVLLDGVRIVPVDLSGRVDLNTIPLALIDRVDVLTGGASSTYGADAVAGVVNFITRSDFSGMELSASDQSLQRGDGNYKRTDLTIGANFDNNRGNAVISLGYQESDPVYQGHDRPYSQSAISSYNVNDLTGAASSTTTPSRIVVNSTAYQVDPTGTSFVPYYAGYNFNPYNVFQTPFKRYNMFSSGHYDVSDHLTVYARGMYNNTTVDTIIAPSGVFASNVTVPISNPYLTSAQRNFLCANADSNPSLAGIQTLTPTQCAAATTALSPSDPNYRTVVFQLSRRMPELGPRISDYNTTMFDFRAGVRGDITDKIGFDIYGARGISDKTQTIENYALLSRSQNALLATNTTTCLPPNDSNGCVPLDIFGPTGSITPAMAAYISQPSTTRVRSKLSQAHATISGDTPLQLWARNPVSVALGTEYRKYSASQSSDTLAQTPGELGGAGGAAPNINGSLDVYEGFAEVIAPIISDKPFFDELQVEAGIRRSHYTIQAPGTPKFDTTTWKLAGSWAPVRDLKIRADYNHAVRAPNIGELFTPVTVGLVALSTDPCAGTITDPNLIAVCQAQGAPAASIGKIPLPTSGQAEQTSGGNPFIRPETAKSWTIGGVLRPRFTPGLSATVDYYNIEIDHAITRPTASDVMNACFGTITSSSATSVACTGIRRNPSTGALSGSPADTPGLPRPLTNAGKVTTDGVDFTVDYRRPLGAIGGAPAKLALALGGNWTRSNKFQAIAFPTAQFPVKSLNRECAGYYSVNCDPAPKWSFNERTTLSLGRIDLSVLWRYIGAMNFEPLQMQADQATATAKNATATTAGKALPCPDFMGADPKGCIVDAAFRHIHPFSYFDFATRFNVNEHFEITFTVTNLFDKQPPVVGNTIGTTAFDSGNTYPSTYDPLGRRFTAGARIKF